MDLCRGGKCLIGACAPREVSRRKSDGGKKNILTRTCRTGFVAVRFSVPNYSPCDQTIRNAVGLNKVQIRNTNRTAHFPGATFFFFPGNRKISVSERNEY